MVSTCRKAEMEYTKWSPKSKGIPFKSDETGVGDGEDMAAAELGTVVLGQNSPHDMIVDGKPYDVKKLDANDDFNTGKKARDVLRPTKGLHNSLLDSMNALAENEVFTEEQKEFLRAFKDVNSDELCVSNLRKLEKACRILQSKKQELRSTLPFVPVTIHGQTEEIPLDKSYSICQMVGLAFPQEYSSYVEKIQVLQKMDHVYIDEPDKFMKDLNSLAEKIFSHVGLIIVHEEKGYMMLKDASKIRFLRITRGCPRFQVIF